MYTPSLYGGLVSYLCEEPAPANRRIALFSYGSGLASSFFSLRINEGPALDKLLHGLSDVKPRLESRFVHNLNFPLDFCGMVSDINK